MPVSTFGASRLFKFSMSILLLVAISIGIATPRPARADLGDAIAVGIVGGVIVCATNPQLCGGNSNGGGGGVADAVALNQTQKMWVQGGLQNLGFYTGALDGAIGAGTRAAIRQYQAAISEPATGALTGKQINDLVALSPSFIVYEAGDRQLFNADLANDLTRQEMAQLQAALNQNGFYAGGVDGAFGAQTRTAITAYKAQNGLPGVPVASRRLLAHIQGWPAPAPAGRQFTTMDVGEGEDVYVTESKVPVATPPETTSTMNASAPDFDVNGVKLGMSEVQVATALKAAMGAGLLIESADADAFGGSDKLSRATLTVQPGWPDVPAEQVLALYDRNRPDLGLVALFRLIKLPEAVDQAAFEAQVLPDIVAKYGQDRMVGNGLWISNAAIESLAQIAECGALRVETVPSGSNAAASLWSAGNGVQLDTGSIDTVRADCGQVLSVEYEGSVIRIGLWNSAALSNAVTAPKIKF